MKHYETRGETLVQNLGHRWIWDFEVYWFLIFGRGVGTARRKDPWFKGNVCTWRGTSIIIETCNFQVKKVYLRRGGTPPKQSQIPALYHEPRHLNAVLINKRPLYLCEASFVPWTKALGEINQLPRP